MSSGSLSGRDSFYLSLQRWINRFSVPLIYAVVYIWMKAGRNYKINHLRRIRNDFRRLTDGRRGPLIMVSNHLSMIDSFILLWALASPLEYAWKPHLFAWNLPEWNNFFRHLGLRTLCYLGKCIPVVRGGSQDRAKKTFNQVTRVLALGDAIMIFPEGGRSRSGIIELGQHAYAVGRFVQACPQARILGLYLRGLKNGGYSDVPPKGEEFQVHLRLLHVRSELAGLKGARDLSNQLIQQLKEMEMRHFQMVEHARRQ